MKNRFLSIMVIALTYMVVFTSCAEPRYYRVHHDHSQRYYRHHHRTSSSIDVRIHN